MMSKSELLDILINDNKKDEDSIVSRIKKEIKILTSLDADKDVYDIRKHSSLLQQDCMALNECRKAGTKLRGLIYK